MDLKEYWDSERTSERTLKEFRLFVSKYKTLSATILGALDPYLFHLIFFHFGSYHRERSLIQKQLSSDEIKSFKEY
jgi:hypothetical protein